MHKIISTEKTTQNGIDIPCGVIMIGSKEGNNFKLKLEGSDILLHKDKCMVLSDVFHELDDVVYEN